MSSSNRISSLSPKSHSLDDDMTEAAIYRAKLDYTQQECAELRAKLSESEASFQAQRSEQARENVAQVQEVQQLRARAQDSERKLAAVLSRPSTVPVQQNARRDVNSELQDAAKALEEAEQNISRGSAKRRSSSNHTGRSGSVSDTEPACRDHSEQIAELQQQFDALLLENAKERNRAEKYKNKALDALKLVEKTVKKEQESKARSSLVNEDELYSLRQENECLKRVNNEKIALLAQVKRKVLDCESDIAQLQCEILAKEKEVVMGIDRTVGEMAEESRELARKLEQVKERERKVQHLSKKIQSTVHKLQAEEQHRMHQEQQKQERERREYAKQEKLLRKEEERLRREQEARLQKKRTHQYIHVKSECTQPCERNSSIAMFIPLDNEAKCDDHCTCTRDDIDQMTYNIHHAGQFSPSRKLHHSRHVVKVQIPVEQQQQPQQKVKESPQQFEQAPWGVHADICTRYTTRPVHQQHHTTFPTPY